MTFRKLLAPLWLMLLMLASSQTAFAQNEKASDKAPPTPPDKVSGKYEGIAKSSAVGDIPLVGEIKNDKGKLSGKIDTPQGSMLITEGSYAEGRISIKFETGGTEGTAVAQLEGDKITGKWTIADQTGTIELKRVGAQATAPAATSDPISGEWEAVAYLQGQQSPFILKLKLEGDKVAGESSSALGDATISKGSIAGDKLTLVLDTPNGAVTLTGTIASGKITGQVDFASQAQGKWEAKRK